MRINRSGDIGQPQVVGLLMAELCAIDGVGQAVRSFVHHVALKSVTRGDLDRFV